MSRLWATEGDLELCLEPREKWKQMHKVDPSPPPPMPSHLQHVQLILETPQTFDGKAPYVKQHYGPFCVCLLCAAMFGYGQWKQNRDKTHLWWGSLGQPSRPLLPRMGLAFPSSDSVPISEIPSGPCQLLIYRWQIIWFLLMTDDVISAAIKDEAWLRDRYQDPISWRC